MVGSVLPKKDFTHPTKFSSLSCYHNCSSKAPWPQKRGGVRSWKNLLPYSALVRNIIVPKATIAAAKAQSTASDFHRSDQT